MKLHLLLNNYSFIIIHKWFVLKQGGADLGLVEFTQSRFSSRNFLCILYLKDFQIQIGIRESGLRVGTPMERVIFLVEPQARPKKPQLAPNLTKLDSPVLCL